MRPTPPPTKPRWSRGLWAAALAASWGLIGNAPAAVRIVDNSTEFRAALGRLQPGDTLALSPGTYFGNLRLDGLRGTPDAPIVIRARDTDQPPVILGSDFGLHLQHCAHIHLKHLRLTGFSKNAITVQGPGNAQVTPAQDLLLEDLVITETHPREQAHAIALSGVRGITIRRCRIEAWGGAAIDIRGAAEVRVDDCRLIGREGRGQRWGIRMHGGSRDILVRHSLFRWAGEQALLLGIPAGPADRAPRHPGPQVQGATIAGNRFFGSVTTLLLTSAHDSVFLQNTIVLPHLAPLAILPDDDDPTSANLTGVRFERNLCVLDPRVIRTVTLKQTSRLDSVHFHSNAWFRVGQDRPIRLPIPETDGLHGLDPRIALDGSDGYRVGSDAPELTDRGADAYRVETP